MHLRRFPHGGWLIATLMFNVAVTVPLAYLIVPHLRRSYHLAQLTSVHPERRQAALGHVTSRVATDPRVSRGALAKLAQTTEPILFGQIVDALDGAGRWRRPTVPADLWLAWLRLIASDVDPEARILVAQRTGQLHRLSDDPRVPSLLAKLVDDQNPDVRYNALVATAELATIGSDPTPYWSLIERATNDPQPQIARQAWLLAGLLTIPINPKQNWQTQPAPVNEAMLWARLQTTQAAAPIGLEVLQDPSADPSLAAMAIYGLNPTRLNTVNLGHDGLGLSSWRWILKVELERLAEARRCHPTTIDGASIWNLPGCPVTHRCAMAYRLGLAIADPNLSHRFEDSVDSGLIQLAALEGQRVGIHDIDVTDHMPPMVRWAAIAATKDPDPEDLFPLCVSDQAQMRDLACLIAAQRLTQGEQHQLVGRLLPHFNDHAKMSGAILSGLTGTQSRLLARRSDAEDVWLVRQIQRLGLWMQGRLDTLDPQTLLQRADVPKSTVLLAMLHRDRIDALDYLFNPRGEPLIDLVQLLDHYRWWHVLRCYLPNDAPPFWLWADPALKAFQVEVLRNWYLVQRRKLGG